MELRAVIFIVEFVTQGLFDLTLQHADQIGSACRSRGRAEQRQAVSVMF